MPEVQLTKEWLELEKSLGYRPLIGGSVENIRKGKGDLTKMLAGQWPPADPGLKTRPSSSTSLGHKTDCTGNFRRRVHLGRCLGASLHTQGVGHL